MTKQIIPIHVQSIAGCHKYYFAQNPPVAFAWVYMTYPLRNLLFLSACLAGLKLVDAIIMIRIIKNN
jgi:hypothetical protein